LRAGDMVSVSGLRQADGTIIATRVDQKPDDDRVIVRGTATSVTAASVRVGDLDIALAPGTTPPKVGEHVFAAGRILKGEFTPDVISGRSVLAFGADVTDISLEAYAPQAAASGAPLVINGVNVSGAALPPGTAINDHIVVTGRVSGPDSITATNIGAVRTVVTINAARGAMRPSALRPDGARPERVAPRATIERPQVVKPETPAITRPVIERPQGIPSV